MQRRRFLTGLGAGLGALGAIPLLRPASALAGATPVKKILFFLTANGPDPDGFYPAAGAPIASGECLSPLSDFESRLCLVTGLDNRAAMDNAPDHQPDYKGMTSGHRPVRGARIPGCTDEVEERCFAWRAGGTSIDLLLADAVGADRPHPRLFLGVNANMGSKTAASFRGGAKFYADNNPFNAYGTLFEAAALPSSERSALATRRRRVLDAVRGDLGSVRRRLGCEHRAAFDQHLESLSALERQFDAGGACSAPALGAAFDVSDAANIPAVSRLQQRLMVSAMSCDMTRVGVLQYLTGMEDRLPFAPVNHSRGNWHNIIHGGSGASERDRALLQRSISRWFATELASLLRLLSETPDAAGTRLLDNTVVVWLHEQGSTAAHRRFHIPVVLAGSCGGALRAGRFQYREGAMQGRPHNALLVTLAQAMGASAIERVGDEDLNTGVLSEIMT